MAGSAPGSAGTGSCGSDWTFLAALGARRPAGLAGTMQADVDHLAARAADRSDRGADQADHLLLAGAADGQARRSLVEHNRDRRDIAAQREQEGGRLGEPVLLADQHHHRRRAGAAGDAGGALGIDRLRRGERDRGLGGELVAQLLAQSFDLDAPAPGADHRDDEDVGIGRHDARPSKRADPRERRPPSLSIAAVRPRPRPNPAFPGAVD